MKYICSCVYFLFSFYFATKALNFINYPIFIEQKSYYLIIQVIYIIISYYIIYYIYRIIIVVTRINRQVNFRKSFPF